MLMQAGGSSYSSWEGSYDPEGYMLLTSIQHIHTPSHNYRPSWPEGGGSVFPPVPDLPPEMNLVCTSFGYTLQDLWTSSTDPDLCFIAIKWAICRFRGK